jgi:hypothetical protein
MWITCKPESTIGKSHQNGGWSSKTKRPDTIVTAFRGAGIRTECNVKRQDLIPKAFREAATEIRHWQFSKARIKCSLTEPRLLQQIDIEVESGKVKQTIYRVVKK